MKLGQLPLPMFATCAVVLAAGLDIDPKAQEIMAQSVRVTEGNWAAAPQYSVVRTEAKSKRDAEPAKKTFQVLMIEGSPYSRLLAEGGQPLSAARQAEEDAKLQQEVVKRSHESKRENQKRIAKYTDDRNRDHLMLCELANAFVYKLVGEETMAGHRVWVLEGTPRPGYEPKSTETKVLANMKAKFWIDQASYQWLRVEAEVLRPVSLYGALAKVGAGTQFVLDQAPVSAHVWLPKHFMMKVNAAALGFINENSSSDEDYKDYKPNAQVVSDLKIPEMQHGGQQ
jgi:hypothetical protein